MSGMTGPELKRELTARQQEIPIICITGRQRGRSCRLIARGAVECLFKLVGETAFVEALKTALQVPRAIHCDPQIGDHHEIEQNIGRRTAVVVHVQSHADRVRCGR